MVRACCGLLEWVCKGLGALVHNHDVEERFKAKGVGCIPWQHLVCCARCGLAADGHRTAHSRGLLARRSTLQIHPPVAMLTLS